MQSYALIYEGLLDNTSLEDAESVLITRLKLSRDLVDNFFAGKSVIKSPEDKVKTLQTFLEKSGIKVTKLIPPIDPSNAEISHVYEKLLILEERLEFVVKQIESKQSITSSETIEAIGGQFKDGLSKASSLASSLKEKGQAKLDMMQESGDRDNIPQEDTDISQAPPTGFKWMDFLRGANDYSDYGRLKKGFTLAVIAGLFSLFAIFLTNRSNLPDPNVTVSMTSQKAEAYMEIFNSEMKKQIPGKRSKEEQREMVAPLFIKAQNEVGVSIGGSLAYLKSYYCLNSMPPNSEYHNAIAMIPSQLFDLDQLYSYNIIDSDSYDLLKALEGTGSGDCKEESDQKVAKEFLKNIM